MKQEIELKLELPEEAIAAFERSALLPSESSVAELQAVYFDTPDRQLRDHGLSLRIRRSGKTRVQTVKATGGNSGGLFSRAEWEMPVKGDTPVIDARTPLTAALGEAAEAIAPAFEVDVERRTWVLSNGPAKIELVLDKGVVRAGEREQSLCEIELELESGKPAELFALARRIDAIAPVRPGVLAKSERGYQLLDAARTAFKAEPVSLSPDARTEEAFRTIALACVRHYRLNEALLLDQYDPQALHQARVGIRRLRSALTIFKPVLAQDKVARFQTELRWLAAKLGDARDLDVLVGRTKPGALHDCIQAARAGVHEEVGETLASARVRGLLIDLVEWLTPAAEPAAAEAQASGEEPAQRFAAERLQHFYRRVAKRGRDMEKLDDAARHEVRKNAKKLRYASEFFVGLFPGKKERARHVRFIDALADLQDDLGALNDLVSTPGILTQHGLADEGHELDGGGKAKKKLLMAAHKTHGDFTQAKRFW